VGVWGLFDLTMKSPAFQFYPTDYLGSQRVQMLTLEEEGAYIRLLCYCWQHGTIPDDADQLARLIGKGASTTVARVVQAMFQQGPEEGKLIHDRLEQERDKQAQWREKSSAGGRKSAEMRKGGSRVVQPPYQPKGNTPSPSPSPSPSPITEKTKTAAAPPPLPFSSESFAESWADFQRHRSEIRKPLKPTSTKLALKELQAMGEARAVSALRHTVAKGWQGIREPEGEHGANGASKPEPTRWRDHNTDPRYNTPEYLNRPAKLAPSLVPLTPLP
jgi:uncharacterized protein YdaU (DUF1376 family)